jgi:ABC-2 type transport system ATP-binding protein
LGPVINFWPPLEALNPGFALIYRRRTRGAPSPEGFLLSSIIDAEGVIKYYRGKAEPALDKFDLTVQEGRIFTLLGRNGAGKTTFLRIASTQLTPTLGSVHVFGLDAMTEASKIRRRVAITPQEAKPLWTLNPYDHVVLSLMMRGESHSRASEKARRVLQTIELGDVAGVHSEELSGGLRQRILIAMTIACDVELMFLDEPTIGLDPVGRRKVWNELIRLKKEENRTIVLTTHYMDEAEALSDELAIVDKGKVLEQGSPMEVRGRHSNSKIRVDVVSGFSHEELAAYGKVIRVGNVARVFLDEATGSELSNEALRRHAAISIAPVTLDDVFVDLVGSELDEDGVANRRADQEKANP